MGEILNYSRTYFPLVSTILALSANSLPGQTTNIFIGTTPIQTSVKRMGINLGTLTNYDSGQTTQNLLMQNPGFEAQVWNSTVRCKSGTATTCVDENQYSAWPADFWAGATFEVFYGAAAGRTGTITTSAAPTAGNGITLNFNNSGVAPAQGDYLILRKNMPGGSTGGWWPTTSGNGVITDNLTDLPPGTLGKQTVSLSAPASSDSASIAGYFDSLAGKTFVQLNGSYQLQFKAKATGGSNLINVSVARIGVASYLNQPVALSSNWNVYNFTFDASETGTAIGTVGVKFSTVGADSFDLDDVSLTRINGDPTNTTIFRDPVVGALRTLQPGVIRHWGGQLGDTLDNLLTPWFGRQRAGYSASYSEVDVVDYGLHDFLQLCQTVGAEPWFVVPITFSTTDASNLIEYLGGDQSTPYGAKRAALGQAKPWTEVFTKIHLEFGNEAWNSSFKGGSIEYSEPYGQRAQTIFGAMKTNHSYSSANFDLVLGGQAAYPGRNTEIQNNCNNNDSFTIAPYNMRTVDSYADNEALFGSTFAEPEAFVSTIGSAEGLTPGMIYQDYQAIQNSAHPVPTSFYEMNMGTVEGSITEQALNSYVSSLGAGITVADTMLQSLRQFGVLNQNLFALTQYQFTRPDGSTVYLWGSVIDMGVTDRKRPQFLALQLANQALSNGATMLQTVHSGSDPTWNQALINSVELNNAHDLESFAFAQGANLSAVLFNLSRSSALAVTFSGNNAPTGAVQVNQLTSASPTDTNESASVVNIASSSLNSFNPSQGFSLPPYSMTVLAWTVPPNFTVTASPSNLTISAGSSGTATITVAPAAQGFTGNVTFSCSPASTLANVTCSIPGTVTGGSGSLTLTVTAGAAASSPWFRHGPLIPTGDIPQLGMWAVFLAGCSYICARRRKLKILAAAPLLLFVAALESCGGGGSAGSSTSTLSAVNETGIVSVVGTSGSLTNSIGIQVTIQ
jgi:hypothetical protein